ncbi:MAG TPA: hypothetical protein VMV07_05440 [Streptosporangiaceae bacterium]|nr:hypothetical protein [Streptosporangiaceae bacterium]
MVLQDTWLFAGTIRDNIGDPAGVDSQRAIGALLQPLGDDELDIIARGLAALQRAFLRAQEPGTAGHAGSPPPC